jgi:glucosyl-3-phosphoglycerate phosphatase
MTASRLVVWRHGRTEWNATGRFQGHADVALDELGKSQAERAAAVLARMAPVRIVSSDLNRAVDTAQLLSDACGVPVETDARLREIHVGTWEGLTADEVIRADPELAHRYFSGQDFRRSASGETVAEVAERISAVLGEVADSAGDGTTVVVATHGVAGRVGACHFVGLAPESWQLFGGLHNCGWIRLGFHRSSFWRIEEYNVVAPAPALV